MCVKVLHTEIDLHYIERFSSYHKVNTFFLGYKKNQLILYREIVVTFSEIRMQHINILCELNGEFKNIKRGGKYSNHRALNC